MLLLYSSEWIEAHLKNIRGIFWNCYKSSLKYKKPIVNVRPDYLYNYYVYCMEKNVSNFSLSSLTNLKVPCCLFIRADRWRPVMIDSEMPGVWYRRPVDRFRFAPRTTVCPQRSPRAVRVLFAVRYARVVCSRGREIRVRIFKRKNLSKLRPDLTRRKRRVGRNGRGGYLWLLLFWWVDKTQ